MHLKQRQSVRIVSVAAIIAVAANTDGRREIIGLCVGPSEAETFWMDFLRSLRARDLDGVKLVISDAHSGLKAAISRVFDATCQRCRVHWIRNALAHVSKGQHTVVAASHPAAKRGGGGQNQAIGRSRGGRTTKIHALTDGLCRPIAFLLSGGQVADCPAGDLLLEQMPKSPILHADKGYDTNAIRHKVESKGTMPNIPPKANRRWKNYFSPFLYRDRNAIERIFGRLNDFRRIATRHDRSATNFLAAVCLAAIVSYCLRIRTLSGRCDLWRPQLIDHAQDVGEELARYEDLGHLERDIARMADNLRADLDQLFTQRRHQPVADRLRRRQRAQEVAKVVGERLKLKANRVGGVRAAGKASVARAQQRW